MTESFFHPPLYVLRYVYKSSTSGRYSRAEGHVSRSGHSIHLGACEQNTYPSVQLPMLVTLTRIKINVPLARKSPARTRPTAKWSPPTAPAAATPAAVHASSPHLLAPHLHASTRCAQPRASRACPPPSQHDRHQTPRMQL